MDTSRITLVRTLRAEKISGSPLRKNRAGQRKVHHRVVPNATTCLTGATARGSATASRIGFPGHRREWDHLKHRITTSVLAILATVALTQAVAPAQDSGGGDPGNDHEFGQLAQPNGEDPLPPEPAPPVALSPACAAGHACFWKQAGFNGDRQEAGTDLALRDRFLGDYDNSMKNWFGSRKVQIKDSNYNQVDCINAGGERTNLVATADIFRIGDVGSSC